MIGANVKEIQGDARGPSNVTTQSEDVIYEPGNGFSPDTCLLPLTLGPHRLRAVRKKCFPVTHCVVLSSSGQRDQDSRSL